MVGWAANVKSSTGRMSGSQLTTAVPPNSRGTTVVTELQLLKQMM